MNKSTKSTHPLNSKVEKKKISNELLELLEHLKQKNQEDFIKYLNKDAEEFKEDVLNEVKQKDTEELKKEFLIEVLIKEKKAEAELYDEIKHISSNGYFKENDFGKEEDFDEINDKLFNKIKNILLKTKNIHDFNSILTGGNTIEEKEILIEKIIRISIVLLHDHHQQDPKNKDKEYHDTIFNICNLLLHDTSEELKQKIIKFYNFTTGNELRLK